VKKTGPDSARRAIEMLFAFTEQRPSLSVRDLSDELDVPVPSVHRYVAMLRDMGLVEEGATGMYHLTMRTAALGRSARKATPIIDLAEPHMRRLANEIGEAVMLMQMVQGQPVCMRRVDMPSLFRVSFEQGQPAPRLRGGSVRLLLGAMSPAERGQYVDEALALGATPPVGGREHFLAEIERDIARGWAISNQEIDDGVWAAAAPVYEGSTAAAALSTPCPALRPDEERKHAIVESVRKGAADVSNALTP